MGFNILLTQSYALGWYAWSLQDKQNRLRNEVFGELNAAIPHQQVTRYILLLYAFLARIPWQQRL
jgi:hypothetical protein